MPKQPDEVSPEQRFLDEIGTAVDETVAHGAYMELRLWLYRMQSWRNRYKISIAEVARRTGMTVHDVERFERGEIVNPTLDMMARYALALNKQITLGIETLDEEYKADHVDPPVPEG